MGKRVYTLIDYMDRAEIYHYLFKNDRDSFLEYFKMFTTAKNKEKRDGAVIKASNYCEFFCRGCRGDSLCDVYMVGGLFNKMEKDENWFNTAMSFEEKDFKRYVGLIALDYVSPKDMSLSEVAQLKGFDDKIKEIESSSQKQ